MSDDAAQDAVQKHTDPSASDTISSPEVIPIVFVPGVMGSRLTMAQTGLSWDPDDLTSMLSWLPVTDELREEAVQSGLDKVFPGKLGSLDRSAFSPLLDKVATTISPAIKTQRRARQSLSPRASTATTFTALPNSVVSQIVDKASGNATPASLVGSGACLEFWERAGDGSNIYEFWGKTRNWGSVCWGFYGPFLVCLENTFNHSEDHAELHPVFAFGYDWRSSNRDSGKLLGDFISNVALKQSPGANDVIVVTHSMGGLVLRGALLANDKLADKIRGVVHGAQPTNGAVVCYRRFFTGCKTALDGAGAVPDKVLNLIMGSDPASLAYNLSGCPGALQLLPNHIYQKQYDQQGLAQASWVTDADINVDLGDVYAMYQTYKWPGLLGPVDAAQNTMGTAEDIDEQRITKEFTLNLQTAKEFHADVETLAHKVTYALFSTQKATDDSLAFGPYPQEAQGWASPSWAAVGLGNDLTGMGKGVGDGTVPAISGSCPALQLAEAPRFVLNEEHSQVYNNARFRRQAIVFINKLIALPRGTVPGTPQTWALSAALPVDDAT